ncbi:NAD-dependent epimerase/dehydratase family protein [Dyadobacter fermentans]|uniref:NAD-dependent epimerase/dehydratase n=1 Tax=Dyadobacter fermentans (strain ATCC 700827 / DSM 18053 / CIP 107007 / KCTC 52180 / NS114) TaxID=471854 RepID=C6VUM5_DYAFD|nr:NAD-dependent epimerase/dehydratase family protein [Dyadobacter fermentans]ACT91334.1 NAD-dependent epimerase/dehydratase [Dyadobacter fermentans DSM 18053]
MKVLVTGSAGFIGFHTVNKLLSEGFDVVGLDNINDYYSPQLKYARLQEAGIEQESVKWYSLVQSKLHSAYRFVRMDLEDKQQLFSLFQSEKFDYVINLAAQAGVRYSIENPDVYVQSNVIGFHYILEACRHFPPKHLVHASSSSVYGANAKIPFSEEDKVDTPVSLYAATKKSNELMAHAYSHLYGIPITCLRFFTVYGPWGRPDMAPMLFARAISEGKPIKIFNNGEMERDFTFVGDIVNGITKTTVTGFDETPKYRVLNIGNGSPVNLMDFITELEKGLEAEAQKDFMPMQPGDVPRTWASQDKLQDIVNYTPEVKLTDGILEFAKWFQSYAKVSVNLA